MALVDLLGIIWTTRIEERNSFQEVVCGSGSGVDGMVKVKSNEKIVQLLKKKVFLKMVSLIAAIFLPFFLFFCQDFFLVSSFFLISFL